MNHERDDEQEHICLPIHSDMTDAEAARVIEGLGAVLSRRPVLSARGW